MLDQKLLKDVPFIDEDEDVFRKDLYYQEDGSRKLATRPTVLQENVLKYPNQSNTGVIGRYDDVDSAQNTSPTKENDLFHSTTPMFDLDAEAKWAIINRDDRKNDIIVVDNKLYTESDTLRCHDRTTTTTFAEKKSAVETTNNNMVIGHMTETDCGKSARSCGGGGGGGGGNMFAASQPVMLLPGEEKNGHYYLRVVNVEHARIEGLCQMIERYLEEDLTEDSKLSSSFLCYSVF